MDQERTGTETSANPNSLRIRGRYAKPYHSACLVSIPVGSRSYDSHAVIVGSMKSAESRLSLLLVYKYAFIRHESRSVMERETLVADVALPANGITPAYGFFCF